MKLSFLTESPSGLAEEYCLSVGVTRSFFPSFVSKKRAFFGTENACFLTEDKIYAILEKISGGDKMTYGKPVSWHDFPNTPGKRVLEEILSTPRPDFTQLDKDVIAYEKKRSDERKIKAAKNK